MNKMVITNEELDVLKELLCREEHGRSTIKVPRILALKLETMMLVKTIRGTPDIFRLTELGKAALTEMAKG